MVHTSNPNRANASISEYSPRPGTVKSNDVEDMEDPCTRKSTGSAALPVCGAPTRLRNIYSLISPFCAQYSLLQIFSLAAPDFSPCAPVGCAKASAAAL